MSERRPNYQIGDRVLVETFGGTLPPGKYNGTVESMRICPDREAPFYDIGLDVGAHVSSFEKGMALLEKKVVLN